MVIDPVGRGAVAGARRRGGRGLGAGRALARAHRAGARAIAGIAASQAVSLGELRGRVALGNAGCGISPGLIALIRSRWTSGDPKAAERASTLTFSDAPLPPPRTTLPSRHRRRRPAADRVSFRRGIRSHLGEPTRP